MGKPFDAEAAAAVLAEAWTSGALLDGLPEAIRPSTMMQGYDAQDRLIAMLGRPVSGWKLGLGSVKQKRELGVGRSVAGRILSTHLHADGAVVPLPNAAPVTVEFEIAYVLGRDILPAEAPFPVMEAVAEIRPSFELVLSRFVDRRTVGWPSFAADNGGFEALVLGEVLAPGEAEGLAGSVVVSCDGVEMARGLTGEDATDPVAAYADLVAVARERGMVLPKGSILSTGTVSKPFDVTGAVAIEAAFLGRRLGFRMVPGKGR